MATNVTVSAGGIVLNTKSEVLVVNQRGNSWSLPKGHVDPGEEPVEAARREVQEETGVTDLRLVQILGSFGRYKIGQKEGEDKSEWKVMIFYLFKTSQMNLQPQDDHHPEARWVHPDEVELLLTHPQDKAFYKSIRPLMK